MSSFSPKQEYIVTNKLYRLKEFHDYADGFITRPPYQRKSVWSTKKKQALLDSLFRKYYIPRIVIREVRLSDDRTVNEVVDGQQRIITAQEFFDNILKLPETLKDIHPGLAGKVYKDLDIELRKFIDMELQYEADFIKSIDNPKNPEHQKIATEIFWRLQQGESLNFMEIAHARLTSLVRNFVVKYADDLTFDFASYTPTDSNPNKHKFFRIYSSENDRMQHLLLLTRLLMLEKNGGATELKDAAVAKFIEDTIEPDGIGNDSYEKDPSAKKTLSILNSFYEIFKDDPMIDENSGLKELNRDYVVISLFLLLRHLKNSYVFKNEEMQLFSNFFLDEFYPRWKTPADNDRDIFMFSDSRQMDQTSIEERDQIIRQLFFAYLKKKRKTLLPLDQSRSFDEAQRIKIYRKSKGLCAVCLKEGKTEKEATVSWKQYEADHILAHSRGGKTDVLNAQVLCRHHNRAKSNSFA